MTIYDLSFSADSQPQVRLSYDGSTYKSGASDYAYGVFHWNVSGTVFGRASSAAATVAVLHGENMGQVSGKPFVVELDIITPNSGTDPTVIRSRMSGYNNEATEIPMDSHGTIYGLGSYGRATNVRFFTTSGTVTGKYVVEAFYGFGD